MTAKIKPTKKHARKLVELLSHGLVKGIGVQEPGKMCVEAAVCYALGLPHGDNPPCVAASVRTFKIRLNDAGWSSNEARAKGLRRLAIAQLGSDTVDEVVFVQEVALAAIRQVLLVALRTANLHKEAEACENAQDLSAAGSAARSAPESATWGVARSAAWSAACAERDRVLGLSAEIAVQALIKVKSPGCKWLDLAK